MFICKGKPPSRRIRREDEETGELRFVLSEDSPAADADLIVLDEVSMVNKELADLRVSVCNSAMPMPTP